MEFRDGLLLLSMFGHLGTSIYTISERRKDKTTEQIAALSTRVTTLDSDVTALKASAEKAPDHDDLGHVYEAIKAQGEKTNHTISLLAATVNQLVGENRGQTDTLRLILNRITEKGLS